MVKKITKTKCVVVLPIKVPGFEWFDQFEKKSKNCTQIYTICAIYTNEMYKINISNSKNPIK